MKKQHIIFLALVFFAVSCKNPATNPKETPEEIQNNIPFVFQKDSQFDNRTIQSLFISSKGDYYVGTPEGIYRKSPQVKRFVAVNDFDSNGITKLKEFNGRLYGSIANNNLIVSSDNGIDWKRELRLTRPIFDFWVTPDSAIVMASNFGTYTKMPGVDEIYRSRFLSSKLLTDNVVALSQTENGQLFSGSHDGIYKSEDGAKNWFKTSYQINKNFDNITLMLTDRNNRLIAVERIDLYISSDNGSSWDVLRHPGEDPFQLLQNNDGRFYTLSADGFYVSTKDELDFSKGDLQPHIGENYAVSAFHVSADKIIITDGNSVFFGTINMDSPFWDDK